MEDGYGGHRCFFWLRIVSFLCPPGVLFTEIIEGNICIKLCATQKKLMIAFSQYMAVNNLTV